MQKILLVLFLNLSVYCISQRDFNEFRTSLSAGSIPQDFTTATRLKVKSDIDNKEDNLSGSKKAVFYKNTNYAVDELLHSGLVIYGDEISKYATEILDRLLKNDKKLRSELRLYTVKSNATNAFTTDQGIIFITTGLLAQMTSEAQLAYVLAHEVIHYKEKHLVQTFEWKIRNYKYSDRISRLSNYSKEHEFAADKGGIKIYHGAGYPKEAIYETFEVLMYSYLPFDEVEFPNNYFNSDKLFIPESIFSDKVYEITAEEDYDDRDHSHPNIKKRKDSISEQLEGFSDWGSNRFYLGEERFKYVRNIARFESIRSDILEAKYGDALYSIFLLEREFQESIYLKRMKAQIWYDLFLYRKHNNIYKVVDATSKMEGSSAKLHAFIKQLSKDEMASVALRIVYDLHQQNQNDEEIQAIYNNLVRSIARFEDFEMERFSEKTFHVAAEEFAAKLKDSLGNEKLTDEKTKPLSKYEKIKRKKDIDVVENFDSTNYYLYGMYDILSDSSFLNSFNAHRNDFSKEMEDDKYEDLSAREKVKLKNLEAENRMKIGADSFIVVEPKVFSSQGNKNFDPLKSEQIEEKYSEIIKSTGTDLGLDIYRIDQSSLEDKGTNGYNQRSILISFLDQIAEDDDIESFPVDYQLLKEIKNEYGTGKIMFTLVEHRRQLDIRWSVIGFSALVYPTLPFVLTTYVPYKLITQNTTRLYVLIMDIDKGIIETGNEYTFREPLYKHNLGAHIYDILLNLSSTPQ